MKWLLDEMLPAATCRSLTVRGHDAVHVCAVGLAGANDDHVFDFAVRKRRVVVTENFADYSALLDLRIGRGEPYVPIVFVRKAALPRGGALANRLAARLDAWARAHADPYIGPHWA